MLRSMTGFGQAQRSIGGYQVQIDIRSVNHRYCEIAVRLPREWARFEDLLRKTVQESVKRGRVEVFVGAERTASSQKSVVVDWSLVDGYREAAGQIKARLGLTGQLTLGEILAIPDVVIFQEHHIDSEETFGYELQQCAIEALSNLVRMKETEGRHLKNELLDRLQKLDDYLAAMKQLAPRVVEDYRDKLLQRLDDLFQGKLIIDESRLMMEVALFADKCNIDEELARLHSHLSQFRKLMEEGGTVGRKLDFLIQEMNREVNTIASKANHADLASLAVDSKAEIEKLREQVQNIE